MICSKQGWHESKDMGETSLARVCCHVLKGLILWWCEESGLKTLVVVIHFKLNIVSFRIKVAVLRNVPHWKAKQMSEILRHQIC